MTDFGQLRQELEREDFQYVVPDFRLNKAFNELSQLPQKQKDKVEFLCNECCRFDCKDRAAMRRSAARIWAKVRPSIAAPRPTLAAAIASQRL